jgi:hypothetical protein
MRLPYDEEFPMREQRRSPAPAAALRRFAAMIALLQKRGYSEERIESFIREKIAVDLSQHRERQRQPSLN